MAAPKKSGLEFFRNAPVEKKAKGREVFEKKMVGIDNVAAIKSLIDSLTGLLESESAEIKAEANTSYFIPEIERLGVKPENFRGIEGESSASIEMRKRGTNSPLKPEEIETLDELKVPYGFIQNFKINPKYVEDNAVMSKVGEALMKIKDLPADFLLSNPVSVVTDESVAEACKLKGNELRAALPIVSINAIKPVWKDTEKNAFQKVLGFFGLKLGE